jgi:hypothetical protein
MKSKEEILQRLEETRAEKESCDEAVREAVIRSDIRMYQDMAKELHDEICALEWVLEGYDE